MKTGCTFHVKKIHIEISNDTWISVLRNNSSSTIFIHSIGTRSYFTTENFIPWRFPNPPANSISPYRDCIYNTSVLRLFSKTNLRDCFQSQSCINSIESGTIATFYRYKQTIWICSAWTNSAEFSLSWYMKAILMLPTDGQLPTRVVSDMLFCLL